MSPVPDASSHCQFDLETRKIGIQGFNCHGTVKSPWVGSIQDRPLEQPPPAGRRHAPCAPTLSGFRRWSLADRTLPTLSAQSCGRVAMRRWGPRIHRGGPAALSLMGRVVSCLPQRVARRVLDLRGYEGLRQRRSGRILCAQSERVK